MTLRTYWKWLTRRYDPTYDSRKAPLFKEHSDFEGLVANSAEAFVRYLSPYVGEFRWLVGQLYNDAFMSIDPELYYSIIRRHQPNLIIEIGCGHSTYFARDAVRSNGRGKIICVDPHPNAGLPNGIDHVASRVEDLPLDFFSRLQKDDILFIDSSHTTIEAQFHCQKILPRLEEGVLIQHHDFTFPYQIYHKADRDKYGEPDVLLSFYSSGTSEYEILLCASYVIFSQPDLARELVRSYRMNPFRIPGSLWVRKRIN